MLMVDNFENPPSLLRLHVAELIHTQELHGGASHTKARVEHLEMAWVKGILCFGLRMSWPSSMSKVKLSPQTPGHCATTCSDIAEPLNS